MTFMLNAHSAKPKRKGRTADLLNIARAAGAKVPDIDRR